MGGDMGHDHGGSMEDHGMSSPHDHEMALERHRQGGVPPLKVLMRQIRRQYPGKVLDVRLERGSRGDVYVFTILQKSRVRQVRVPVGRGTASRRTRTYNFNRRPRP